MKSKLRYRSAPPGSSVLVYLTYPSNYHKHHLSIHKNGLSLSTTYLPTYLPVPPL